MEKSFGSVVVAARDGSRSIVLAATLARADHFP
jgi:hypothetical protein